jgi:hypothetical protein
MYERGEERRRKMNSTNPQQSDRLMYSFMYTTKSAEAGTHNIQRG